MNEGDLQQEIIDHEGGILLKPYKCTSNKWTIGAGHLIKDSEKHEFRNGITYETGLKLFLIDFSIAKRDMQTFLKPCGDMPDIVQEVCLEMAFQIGLPKLNKFVKFKQALADENWSEAIEQMKDSRWYNQTPNRARSLMDKMKKLI
jgi:GH24 family phage-related lysozyme (muramidase)